MRSRMAARPRQAADNIVARILLFALVLAPWAFLPGLARDCAAGECWRLRAGDELWMIRTRGLDCPPCGATEVTGLAAQHYEPCRGFREASLTEFLFEETAAITVFFINGNREDDAEMIEDGLAAYRVLTACGGDSVPVRFVIWSWPSDKVIGQIRDFRVKARRTDCESYYVGWVLTHLPPTTPVSLIGYSFGARIASGALHLAAGGVLSGRRLPPAPGLGAVSARAVLLAPAFDCDWLSPDRPHGLALTQADHLWLSVNPCDPVLKRYPLIIKGANPQAIGFAGPSVADWPMLYRERAEPDNVGEQIGKSHWLETYLESPYVGYQLRRVALWAPVSPLDAALASETMHRR